MCKGVEISTAKTMRGSKRLCGDSKGPNDKRPQGIDDIKTTIVVMKGNLNETN